VTKGTVTIRRYNPEIDAEPHSEVYDYPFEPGMTVLDVARYIYENVDASFGFSYCCRNIHCGLCGAKINSKSGLMCREGATREMTLAPLDNLNVIRDLIVDRQDGELGKAGLRLFLDRSSLPEREPETIPVDAQQRFKVVSRCVECYSCVSACPAMRRVKHLFLGPANFVLLARYVFDPRDELDRTQIALSGGISFCESCAKCTQACSHEINPAKIINILRHEFVAAEEKNNSEDTSETD